MRFQRSLKGSRPLPRGYYAPVTDRVNIDPPTFQIGGNTEFSINNGIQLPEFLKVKARLNPIKRQGEEVFAIVERQDIALKPYAIYQEHEDCHFQSLQLVFESFLVQVEALERLLLSSSDLIRGSIDSRVKRENDNERDKILFEKQFITQNQGLCVLRQDAIERKLIITPPGRENGQLLWGYGGYYKIGGDLKQIEQIFFTPIGQSSETNIHLTKASAWAAKGVMPSLSHAKPEVCFMEGIKDEWMLNLVGEIEKGKACLWVQIGIDEGGAAHKQEYRSISIQQEDALTPFVEILFKKGE